MSQTDTTAGSTKQERMLAIGGTKNIRLRDFKSEDATVINQWLQNPNSTVSVTDPKSLPGIERIEDFLTEYARLSHDYLFVGELKKQPTPVGTISLIHEDDAVEFRNLIVPESYRIFRLEMALSVLAFAFDVLKVNHAHAFVANANNASLQFHTSLGFRMVKQIDTEEWRGHTLRDLQSLQMERADFERSRAKYGKSIFV